MKRMKKALAAGFLGCATLGSVNAEKSTWSPWNYGLHLHGTNTSLYGLKEEVKVDKKKAKTPLFDCMFVGVGGYFEWAFSEYVGLDVRMGYLKNGASLIGEKEASQNQENNKDDKEKSVSFATYGISLPMHVSIYPLGREEGEGIFKLNIGPALYFPLAKKALDDKDADIALSDETKKELSNFDVGLNLGLSYEFNNGLSVDYLHGFHFLNRFNLEENKSVSIWKDMVDGLNRGKSQSMHFGLGYNVATLFRE